MINLTLNSDESLAAATAGALMPPEYAREMGHQMEAVIATLPAAECQLRRIMLPGWYLKELTIPADVCLSGHTHLTEHMFMVSQGDHSFWTAHDGFVRVQAPFYGITKAGTKRIGRSHTDTVWTTFHPNPDNLSADEMDAILLEPWENPYLKRLQ